MQFNQCEESACAVRESIVAGGVRLVRGRNLLEDTVDHKESLHSPSCTDLMIMAERELAAFLGAVTELYGAEQAEISAEIWLDELESMNSLPGAASRDWRAVTVAALACLATHRSDTKVSSIPSSNCFVAEVLV